VLHPGLGEEGIRTAVDRLLDEADGVPHGTALDIGPRPQEWATPLPAPGTALIVNGSPRGARSSSACLGRYLSAQLAQRGVKAGTEDVCGARRTEEDVAKLLDACDAADLVVLSFPLYVDSLPAGMIRMLERMAAHRRRATASSRGAQRLTAIVQCGFPEVRHNYTALAICREFAGETGFIWAGGLPLGGGHGLVQSKPLETLGGRAAHVRKALDLAAAALAAGRAVPDEAVALLARPFVPSWLYRMFGNLGWILDARRYGARGRLRDRPYTLQG
jgi:multimeric flavodoxin WrbA